MCPVEQIANTVMLFDPPKRFAPRASHPLSGAEFASPPSKGNPEAILASPSSPLTPTATPPPTTFVPAGQSARSVAVAGDGENVVSALMYVSPSTVPRLVSALAVWGAAAMKTTAAIALRTERTPMA
jgi:hypothetical protein